MFLLQREVPFYFVRSVFVKNFLISVLKKGLYLGLVSPLSTLQGQLIISVQAEGGEPLNTPEILTALAESALAGGARGLRMANAENIRVFKAKHPNIPVIGLSKPDPIPANYKEIVYITPTGQDVAKLAEAGADILALDATGRPRPGGETLEDLVAQAKAAYPDKLLMADIATLGDGLAADRLGFDCMGTTLSGYTQETEATAPLGPDFQLLADLVTQVKIPVILEGRVWEPAEVQKAFELGAFAVVIGSAVTRPHHIVKRFCQALPGKV